jgi:hypothetical protein
MSTAAVQPCIKTMQDAFAINITHNSWRRNRGGTTARLAVVQQDESQFLADALEEVAARKL